MKKKIVAAIVMVLISTFSLAALPNATVSAGKEDSGLGESCSEPHFLGLRAWYDGLYIRGTSGCRIVSPKEYSNTGSEEENIRAYVWTIVMNIVSMVLGIAGYLAIGFVMFGGFQYVMAQGDINKATRARKTIVNSVIGLTLIMTASIISGAISDIINSATADENFMLAIFNKAFVWGGIITAIMIVWGGIQYITSIGGPDGVNKAKKTILYSVIGLAVIILAATIVNTVVNTVSGGGTEPDSSEESEKPKDDSTSYLNGKLGVKG